MFNPIIASKNIKDEFISYVNTSFMFSNEKLRAQLIKELNVITSSGPWLETNDVFKSGKTINQLIDDGILSPLYRDLESKKPIEYKRSLPLDRPLYLHQEMAIKSIASGNNTVISTGTGSGKTNCFLIPVINQLLKEKESNTLGAGVRALFIYPMNALANDQMKNIRKILMCYPDITFGVYNGSAEYKDETALAVYEAMFANDPIPELRKKLPNELLSRDSMKSTPPNILFTNYAMLEHLLFRPNDDVLFSNSDFRFVVLDEAHVYSGATGIETSMLLRRLRARINVKDKTQFILTSATLGNKKEHDDDIVTFAKNLCGVDFQKQHIIRAERENYVKNDIAKFYPYSLFNKLANEENIITDVLTEYNIKYDSGLDEKEILYNLIKDTQLYDKFRENISKVSKLEEIKNILEIDDQTTISFITLCTKAQKNNKALIDARYHFFIRSLEGCFITLNPEMNLYLTRKKFQYFNDIRYEVFEVSLCNKCGRFAIVGKIVNGHLMQVNKIDEQVSYFYLAEDENNDLDDEEDEFEDLVISTNKKEYFYLCKHCGSIVREENFKNVLCDCDRKDFVKVVESSLLKSGPKCGNCHSGRYMRFYLGNDAATSVLATALYEELPDITYEEKSLNVLPIKSIFGQPISKQKKHVLKKSKQFLAFSDNRQEAAKFACYLSKSYEEFLRRRGICNVIQEQNNIIINSEYTISDFTIKLSAYFSNKRCFALSNLDNSNLHVKSHKNAWIAMINELARFNSPTSLTSLGILQFKYIGNTDILVDMISSRYNANKQSIYNMLNLLMFEIVKAGAICSDNDTDIDDNAREYIFYSSLQKCITKYKSPENNKSHIIGWMPRSKKGKNEFYRSNKLNYVMKCLNINEHEANDFLDEYFEYLTNPAGINEYCLEDKNKDGNYVLPAKYIQVCINGVKNTSWYKCSKCGKVSQFALNGQCVTIKCDNQVSAVDPNTLHENNHFANLYFLKSMVPLYIKEHTAQLSKKESAEYQEQFIKKEINALSCSTTFEMGVDVGDLETVFLRDVPPLPSNYAQRAGRAGRTINAAAFCLTFAKLSSHDLSFFKEPEKMISGTILPPLFKVDNEKIVRRHIYAITLSMYFSQNADQYNGNNADKFINQKGYIQFINWIKSKPSDLQNLIYKSIPNIDNLYDRIGIHDFEWVDEFSGSNGVFTSLIREYESNIKEFERLMEEYHLEKEYKKYAYIERKLNNYKSNKLIEFLARGNILPRYGFPVNTVELEQNTTAGNINKLRLNRDLQMAISEYAPSSEIIADGKLYTSRYIKKSSFGNDKNEWDTAYIGQCTNPKCQTVNYSITPISNEGKVCSSCERIIPKVNFHESIEPRNGFVTEKEAKEVPLSKQEKNYRSDDFYIGNIESKTIDKYTYKFNNTLITIESTTNDSLMVKSAREFYVCPNCGYSLMEDETITKDKEATKKMKLNSFKIRTLNKHESILGQYKCECQELFRYSLHHTFNTDVARISFDCDTSDYKTMISTMYALLYSISAELNIERRDIKACLSSKFINNQNNYSIIIYDAVPGGAGHSRRLVTPNGEMLKHIIKVALKSVQDCQCDPSCYNCLRSYENQKIHDELDRKLTSNFLSELV